jgi:hypothetical protein
VHYEKASTFLGRAIAHFNPSHSARFSVGILELFGLTTRFSIGSNRTGPLKTHS